MKTNKERALELVDEKTEKSLSTGWLISNMDAVQAVDLASKPDWYYPSKGEFPEFDENAEHNKIIVKLNAIYAAEQCEYNPNDKTCTPSGRVTVHYQLKDIVAWSYLPKFEENE